jgi:aryl carrier-like protein
MKEIFVSIRATILEQITAIARQQNKHLVPLTDQLHLVDSGLDSLCLAILVANLEDELELDPFASGTVAVPVTLGDFIGLYEAATV